MAGQPLRVGLAGVGRFGQLHAGVLADRHGVATRYGEALELVADDSLDAVVLATPDDQHGPQARAALARVTLQTGLILRYEPSHRWLQQQIAAGSFGDLVSIRARRNCSRTSFDAIADRLPSPGRRQLW